MTRFIGFVHVLDTFWTRNFCKKTEIYAIQQKKQGKEEKQQHYFAENKKPIERNLKDELSARIAQLDSKNSLCSIFFTDSYEFFLGA